MHHFLASVTQSILINAIKKPTLYGIYVLHEHYTVTNLEFEGSGSVNKHLTDKFSIQLNLYKIKMTTALPTHFGWNSSFYFLDFWHVDIRIPSITGG